MDDLIFQCATFFSLILSAATLFAVGLTRVFCSSVIPRQGRLRTVVPFPERSDWSEDRALTTNDLNLQRNLLPARLAVLHMSL